MKIRLTIDTQADPASYTWDDVLETTVDIAEILPTTTIRSLAAITGETFAKGVAICISERQRIDIAVDARAKIVADPTDAEVAPDLQERPDEVGAPL